MNSDKKIQGNLR